MIDPKGLMVAGYNAPLPVGEVASIIDQVIEVTL